jgi:protein phosphatase 2C family protein 2/3
LADEDQFLLLACDGLFDVFSPEEVVDFVRTHMIRHGDAQKCCQVNVLTEQLYDMNDGD